MTIDEAYEEAIAAAEELEGAGLPTEIKRSPAMEGDIEKIERIARVGPLDPEKWVRVAFSPITKDQARMAYEKVSELTGRGICFSVSGDYGRRIWELGWSLRVAEGPEKIEDKVALELAEGLMNRKPEETGE